MCIIYIINYLHKGIILKNLYDVAIIGAGASGLTLAILLAQKRKKVILLERQDRGGKKILASGNGHCNIGNLNISSKKYKANNKELITYLINNCSPKSIVDFFNTLGLEIINKSDGKLFPKSMEAKSVLNLLEAKAKSLNIDIFYNIKDLQIDSSFILSFNNNKVKAKNLVVATGSIAAPQLGGNSSGLDIAKRFNHTITTLLPSLVPLISKDKICKALNGLKIDVFVKLFINNKERTSVHGDILFRNYGVSGLAILDLSIEAVKAIDNKQDIFIVVDFLKDYKKDKAIKYLKSKVDKNRALPINLWLNGFIHSKLANFITKELNLENLTERDLNSSTIKKIAIALKEYKIKIEDFREFKYAEVALGGVNSNEINNNFESKLKKNLYFIGEVLDVVGQRGGYNFHFAWCSAILTAKNFN